MGIQAPEGCLPKCAQNLAKLHQKKTLGNLVTLHFTRQITLKDEYLSQFFPNRKVLWMTFKQLFQIFIKSNMFDCIRQAKPIILRKTINQNYTGDDFECLLHQARIDRDLASFVLRNERGNRCAMWYSTLLIFSFDKLPLSRSVLPESRPFEVTTL